MEKRRVLLISQPNLLGESLEHSLSLLEDVQVIGPWLPDEEALVHCQEQPPDLVLITEDDVLSAQTSGLTSQILEAFPNMTIIRVKQDRNFLLVYTSQSIPARMADLIDTIRQAPIG